MTRQCPVDGCDRRREPSHVMCGRCWALVPQPLRAEVWRTFRAFGPWDDRSVDARESALDHADSALATMQSQDEITA